ncbi:hypothetical protein B0H14DRAFT_2558680 [Mycena olivaceomarginata]|nr:hypothetical protein B0H14DRAFT_2558680 [Mycena olivaceomarginata]
MDDTMDDTGKVYSPTEIKTLRHKLADALKSHANMVDELVEDADELRYRLAVASGNLEDTTRKLVEIKHQLYDLRPARSACWDAAHFVGEAGECHNFGGRSGGGPEIYFNCWRTALGQG